MSDAEKLQAIAAFLLQNETEEISARDNSGLSMEDPEYNYWEGASDVREQVAKIITEES